MKCSKLLSTSILIASALLLGVGSTASGQSNRARPNRHIQVPDKQSNAAKQIQESPMVPLAVYQADLREALRTIHAQEEAAADQQNSKSEPFSAPSNLIAIGLLIVGAVYSIFAWKQWQVLSWASVAEHRPKLGLRQVTLLNDLEKDNALVEPIEVGFFLVNRGSTPAWIVQGNVTLRFDLPDKLPAFNIPSMLPPYDADDAVLKGTKLEPAIQKLFKKQITLDKGDPSAFHAIDPQRAKSKAFYVLGYFVYRDQIGRSYRTAFCRRYRPTNRDFQALGNPDYEYED
jgi:hypothetical protein